MSHMVCHDPRSWRGGLLLLAAVVTALATGAVHAAPSASVSDCTFTPTQGGPGTWIHARVDQWSDSPTVGVGFAVPKPESELQGKNIPSYSEERLQPLTAPLATMQPINGATVETTFRVPARLASGQPLPRHDLYLVCMVNGKVYMGGGADAALFTFTAGNLPVTGDGPGPLGGAAAGSGLALLLVGWGLRRRSLRAS